MSPLPSALQGRNHDNQREWKKRSALAVHDPKRPGNYGCPNDVHPATDRSKLLFAHRRHLASSVDGATLLNFLHLHDEVLEGVSLGQHQLVRNISWYMNNVTLLQLGFLTILY
jgi:hypothetical protein